MPNFIVLEDRDTTAGAWHSATAALRANGNHAFNLIYSINSPATLTTADRNVISIFNDYALSHGLHSTETVANTIFPLDTYLSQGPEEFCEFYLAKVFPKVRKQWGTYFERMIRRHNDDGSWMIKEGEPLNPLTRLVGKVRKRVAGEAKTTTHYELSLDEPGLDLATYEPHHDGAYQLGGPCLSHVSFKVDNAGVLRLTAFYRSHWYVARALGNLIGLARLQAYVATQAKATIGPLTIVAAEAVLDASATGRPAAKTYNMLEACEQALSDI